MPEKVESNDDMIFNSSFSFVRYVEIHMQRHTRRKSLSMAKVWQKFPYRIEFTISSAGTQRFETIQVQYLQEKF